MKVSSWSAPSERPTRPGDRAAQLAADSDNFRTATARACRDTPTATIGPANISSVRQLYKTTKLTQGLVPPPTSAHQWHHLPGDIIKTIRSGGKKKGAGANADTTDLFMDLVSLNIAEVNSDLYELFNLAFNNIIPAQIKPYFSDSYLFCLYKDPDDLTKLRPIGIPSALRRIIASHIAKTLQPRFAQKLWPYNLAVGINDGMNFIIKSVQLQIEKYIEVPQKIDNETPSRAFIFSDITNMFNSVSREALFDIIGTTFPELLPLAHLLYGNDGTVHHRWEDGGWRTISMIEGLNQGCPLSSIFAALVLDRILRPLDNSLKIRSTARLASGDTGDDGYGSIAHILAWVDDVTSGVPLIDLAFYFEEFCRLATPLGLDLNTFKTRILTSVTGESILPDLYITNPTLAAQIELTINTFSQAATPTSTEHPTGTCGVEVTTGFRLLGTPVGSASFAATFFEQQVEEVRTMVASLESSIPDLQTRLRMFSQCIIQKLPHLLGADVMHHQSLHSLPHSWHGWNGPLSKSIDSIIHNFLATLTSQQQLPSHAIIIANISVGLGGLGILNASHRAAPDFVFTMTSAMRYATNGFLFNKDIPNSHLHPSIANLFSPDLNTDSLYLQRFQKLLPDIAAIAVSDKCPATERINHFLHKTSIHSARHRLKQHCSGILLSSLINDFQQNLPQSTKFTTSILTSATSYPLIAMSRSIPGHRLHNWNFIYGILRKLRLPIYDPENCPQCWCGKTHDCWGDHAFCCKENNKIGAHNFIVQGLALALQPILSTAGYILPSSKLDTERLHLIDCDKGAKPLDLSFQPDPDPSSTAYTPCRFPTCGFDVTIVSTLPDLDLSSSEDVITTVTANADTHLQKKERAKFMRANKKDTVTGELIPGEQVMGEMVRKDFGFCPIAIDAHGRCSPLARRCFTGEEPLQRFSPEIPRSHPNAQEMYRRASTDFPAGIVPSACIRWQRKKDRNFFGHSYTAPTPREFLDQQMGLVITKAFGLHLRTAGKRMGHKPPKHPHRQPHVVIESAPHFDEGDDDTISHSLFSDPTSI